MRIALIGYGKMGKAIEEIALQKKYEVVLRATHQTNLSKEELQKADVAIEFTNPLSAFDNVVKCFDAGLPVICGTTGWNEKLEEAKNICIEKKGAFFHASNFSIGVNIFFEMNKKLALMMSHQSQYKNVWLTETHHTQKKDSPSGTAITLANDIINSNSRFHDWKNYKLGPQRKEAADDETVLPVYSMREGDVAGIHEVCYQSEEDRIDMIHIAKGRTGFARGAIFAAEWIRDRQGVFTMKDLLAF
jgi:4-hydroxy-tetrahydrodipicolinate reductase